MSWNIVWNHILLKYSEYKSHEVVHSHSPVLWLKTLFLSILFQQSALLCFSTKSLPAKKRVSSEQYEKYANMCMCGFKKSI